MSSYYSHREERPLISVSALLAQHSAFERGYRGIENERYGHERKQRHEHQGGIEQPTGEIDQKAEATVRANELAHDSADNRERDTDLEAAQEDRQGGRELKIQKGLPSRGTERTQELNQLAIDIADPHDRIDQHGEKDRQGADDHLGKAAGSKPDDQQRSQCDDGNRLRCRQIWGNGSLYAAGLGQSIAQEYGDRQANGQPAEHLSQGGDGVHQQAAIAQGLDAAPEHKPGRGQKEGGVIAQIDD